MEENIKISSLITLLMAVLSFFTNDSIASIAISIIIFIFPCNIVSSIQTDEISNWNKFQLTAPIRRNQIVLAKYFTYLGMVLLGVCFSLLIVTILLFFKPEYAFREFAYPIFYGISLSLFTGAFLFPIILFVGALKSEIVTIVSAILSITLILLIWGIVNIYFFRTDLKSLPIGIISFICSLLLFLISYFIAVYIQQKKEF